MKERMKLVRKKLGLTQEEFADRLGIKRGAISNYEIGRNVPIDAVLSLICKEFGVNGEWLRTGEGEMFAAAPSTVLDALAQEYDLRQKDYVLIEKLVHMSPVERDGIFRFMQDVVYGATAFGTDPDAPAVFSETTAEASAKAPQEMSAAELHAELDRQLAEEKRLAENSSAYGHGKSGTVAG